MDDGRQQRFREMTADRNRKVLDAACRLAEDNGLAGVTRDAVADAAGVSAGTASAAYGDMNVLREAVMREAVSRPLLRVLAQGLAAGHATARAAPDELRQRALETVSA